MTIFEITIIILAGFCTGFINTLAGGGTVISLAALMATGMPLTLANGTHRIAAVFQTLTSSASFRQQKVLPIRKAVTLGIPVALGSILGARIAVDFDEALFREVVAGVMAILLVLLLLRPKEWLKGRAHLVKSKTTPIQYIVFFIIGVYGGFIHIGIGYFLLAGIVLGAGFDLLKGNAVKVFIVMLYLPFALGIFILHDMVDYRYGIILAIGQVVGAFIASRLASKMGTGFIRWFMVVFVAITILQLLSIIDLGKLFS